ncbi:Supporter of activation of yellow protein [Gryllus bimaculatus]|nr:Supporter of activation of yellow protein [Gryllus bimaculatus]
MRGGGGKHLVGSFPSTNGPGGPRAGLTGITCEQRGSAGVGPAARFRVRSGEQEQHCYSLCVVNLTMSEIKNKDRILEAIDQLRRRKARPDADRICNFLLRRFSVSSKDTIADLERMVQAEIVIRVEYKGNISYRNAAKWSRLAVYKHKGNVMENNNIIEVRSLLSRAFASLLVEDPDYLDFGVPENELKKSILEEDPCLEWGDVDSILLREINSGYLVRLKNNNYSLADHPVPSCTTNGNIENSSDVHMLKFESSSSSHFDDEPNNIGGSEEIDTSIKISSPKATDVNNEKSIGIQDDAERRETNPSRTEPHTAVNVSGFRVGVRRKRAKKVFDPSDNNIPTRKRGRPLGSTNKSKDVASVAAKVEPLGPVCSICHHQVNGRRGLYEKFLTCANCTNKAHPSCLDVGDKLMPFWQCMQCKICPHCMQSGEFEQLVTCWGCGDGWHPTCHYPEILERANGSKWYCFRCLPSKPKNVNGTSDSPAPDAIPISYPASASVTSCDSDDQIDECIPDASEWTVDEVSRYLANQGYPEEAAIFKLNEIDGASLLLMKRSDVLLGLQLKLGPALKLYGQVKRLQIRQSDPQLIWA